MSILTYDVNTSQEPQGTLLPVGGPDTPYRSVAVSDITLGQDDDVVATFNVKIGGIIVRRVSLRKGRGNTVYVNYPGYKNEHGKWVHLFEIVSPSLDAFVTKTIHQAVAEVVR